MARKFVDGSEQYLEIDQAVLTSYPLTIACWFNVDDVNLLRHMVHLSDKSETDQAFSLGLNNNGGVMAYAYDGSPRFAESTIDYSAGVWQHGCAVLTNSTLRAAFLDGANKGTHATACSPTGIDRTSIGRAGDFSPGYYMDGGLAEVGIWNAALTDEEVAALATGVSPLAVRLGNLVFYPPLVRDNDEDIVGGLSLTAYNSPTIASHPRVFYSIPPQYFMGAGAVGAYTLDAAQGSYALTGQTVDPLAARLLTSAQGSYALSGQAAGLALDRLIAAAQGSYTLTGQATGLAADRQIAAGQGSYALTGQDAGLLHGFIMAAAQGSYTLTGQDLDLLVARVLAAVQGSYTLTGIAVTLTYTPIGGYTIVAEQGSYNLTGQQVSPLIARLIAADQGAYVLSGQDVSTLLGRVITASQGTYNLSGQDIGATLTRILVAAQGSYSLSGQDIAFVYGLLYPNPDNVTFVLFRDKAAFVEHREKAAFMEHRDEAGFVEYRDKAGFVKKRKGNEVVQ